MVLTKDYNVHELYLVEDSKNIKLLTSYYSLIEFVDFKTKESLSLSKNDILRECIVVNNRNLKTKRNSFEELNKGLEKEINHLYELKEKDPERLKKEAIDSLYRTKVIDENGNIYRTPFPKSSFKILIRKKK